MCPNGLAPLGHFFTYRMWLPLYFSRLPLSPSFVFDNYTLSSKTEVNVLRKRYFRKNERLFVPDKIEWIEMTRQEFYQFVSSPQGQGRFFIDMGDVVLETDEDEARKFKAEQNHSYYILAQEKGWETLSINTVEDQYGCSGEEALRDETQDVEAETVIRMDIEALRTALTKLDTKSYYLIHALYMKDPRETERELAQRFGVSQNAINKRKKKILKILKSMVVKIQKNQQ